MGVLLEYGLFRLTNYGGEFPVKARELQVLLQNTWDYSTWIKERLEKSLAEDGLDFSRESVKTSGRPRVEHMITLDLAKELCMLEGNDTGRAVRRRFIQRDKELTQREQAPAYELDTHEGALEALHQISGELLTAKKREKALAGKVEAMKPKAAFHDQFASADGWEDMRAVAQMLGIGRTRLFNLLRHERVRVFPEKSRVPYQRFIDEGYFKLHPKEVGPDHRRWIEHVPLCSPKGFTYLHKKLQREGLLCGQN